MPCQCFDNNMYVANVIGVIMLACTISHTCTVFVGGDRQRDRETETVDHGDALGLELLQRRLFAGTRYL